MDKDRELSQRALRAFRQLYVDGKVAGKKEFCISVGMYPQNFTKLEQGKICFSITNIHHLVNKYGVSLEWLFFGGDTPVKFNGVG